MTNTLTLIKAVFILCFSISFLHLRAGGGWPQAKGKAYFKLSVWSLNADQHFNDSGLIVPNPSTSIFNANIYGEYGLTDRLTAMVYLPFLTRNSIGEESLTSFGDSDIGIKYGLTKPNSGIALATSLTLGIPFGKGLSENRSILQTGDGEFNQLLQVDAGTGFQLGAMPFYTNLMIGFNNRTNGFSDEWRYGIELGTAAFNKKLSVAAKFNAVESLKNGDTTNPENFTTIFANNTEFVGVTLELGYAISEQLGIMIGIGGATRGERILARPAYNFGVFMKL